MLKFSRLFVIVFATILASRSVAQTIDSDAAQVMISKYKASNGDAFGHTFGSEILREIISPKYVETLLAFKGLDNNNVEHLVFKRANSNSKITDEAYAVNEGQPCPPVCPPITGNKSNTGKRISEAVAQQMVASYQEKVDLKLASFSRSSIEKLLESKDVKGVYFANGLDEQNNVLILAMGLDKDGKFLPKVSILISKTMELEYPLPTSSIKK
jgi:hypothetical protein